MAPFSTESRIGPGKPMNPNSWESSFPRDQSNESNRLRFLARMSYIAVAQYFLYRGLLPKHLYKRRRIEDLIFYVFDAKTRWGFKLSEMMRGIRDAIDNKYVKRAIIMVNEDSENPNVATEVFSISYCYEKGHALRILDEQGNCIVSMGYKSEKMFRMQVKHTIKKLHAVTKQLKPFRVKEPTPQVKLTYYDHTPDDYEPPAFSACSETYKFKEPATFYDIGHIATNQTAISFSLKSVYIKPENVGEYDDLLLEQAGYKEDDIIDPLDVTADGNFSIDELRSPKSPPTQQLSSLVIMETEQSSELEQQMNTGTTTEVTHVSETMEKAREEEQQMETEKGTPEVTHASSETIEKARQAEVAETIQPLNFGSPEMVGDETVMESEDSAEKRGKTKTMTRQSPLAKKRSKRLRNLTPRFEGTHRALQQDSKTSATTRSVLKSPTDLTAYKIA